jgi:hypothetical protein
MLITHENPEISASVLGLDTTKSLRTLSWRTPTRALEVITADSSRLHHIKHCLSYSEKLLRNRSNSRFGYSVRFRSAMRGEVATAAEIQQMNGQIDGLT